MYAKVHGLKGRLAEITVVCEDEARKGPHCGFCSAAGGGASGTKQETILARNDARAPKGSIVEIEIDPHAELKAALILFVIPLATFIASLVAAAGFELPLLQSAAAGGGVLVLTLLLLKVLLRDKTYHRIVRVVPRPPREG
ncbi:hypothetical protein E0L29_08040 [Chlorobium sp. N1]|nr:hypothetical protein E0L29_08040 [Chlorobium sp. N1]